MVAMKVGTAMGAGTLATKEKQSSGSDVKRVIGKSSRWGNSTKQISV